MILWPILAGIAAGLVVGMVLELGIGAGGVWLVVAVVGVCVAAMLAAAAWVDSR